MQLFSKRSRRFRPRLTASALALSLAGGVGAAHAEGAASERSPALEAGQTASPVPGVPFAGVRHRPWRHHIYQRAWAGGAQQDAG